jgi:formylglycine-generating enzyme
MRGAAIVVFAFASAHVLVAAASSAEPTFNSIPATVCAELRRLIEQTFSADARTRGAAAHDLGLLAEEAVPAVPFLIRLLSDDAMTQGRQIEVHVSAIAAIALQKIGKPAVGPCIERLNFGSRSERISLAFILGTIRDPQAINALLPFINDPDKGTSISAIEALSWNFKDRRIVAPLIAALVKSRNADVRRAAAHGLSTLPEPRAVDALLRALDDEDKAVQTDAAYSLGEQRDKRAVPKLLQTMRGSKDEYAGLRGEAALALGKIRDARAFHPLLDLLSDRSANNSQRSAAAAGLGEFGNRDAVPALSAVLADLSNHAKLRADSLRAIAKIDGAASLPILVQIAKSTNQGGEVRFWASLEGITITDGALDDGELLAPLNMFDRYEDEGSYDSRIQQKMAALERVISHAKNETIKLLAARILEHASEECEFPNGRNHITNAMGMKLTLIPSGEFMMGGGESAEATAAFFDNFYGEKYLPTKLLKDEHPQHQVRITKALYLGTYHVTRGQFRQFVNASGYKTEAEKGAKPGAWGWDSEKKDFRFREDYSWRNSGFQQTDEHPVVNVSWNDAVAFCRWLSEKEGKSYRLPTEAEWEYACRAGTKARYYSGYDPETLAKVGNVADAAAKAALPGWKYLIKASDGYVFTSPVGKFRPNAFGLYDMHGNAWEWCADWYGEDYYGKSPVDEPRGPDSGRFRVLRGGSWYDGPNCIRSASRNRNRPDFHNYNVGFRVARAK